MASFSFLSPCPTVLASTLRQQVSIAMVVVINITISDVGHAIGAPVGQCITTTRSSPRQGASNSAIHVIPAPTIISIISFGDNVNIVMVAGKTNMLVDHWFSHGGKWHFVKVHCVYYAVATSPWHISGGSWAT
jgi:hypothetical protein